MFRSDVLLEGIAEQEYLTNTTTFTAHLNSYVGHMQMQIRPKSGLPV